LRTYWPKNKEAARSTIERFEAAVKGSLLSVEHRLVEAPASFSEMARRYDLSVVMQSNNENGVNNDILIEATLFESGRPVIVVPYIQKEGMNLDRIVCCWAAAPRRVPSMMHCRCCKRRAPSNC
jgi:hypothetical protein